MNKTAEIMLLAAAMAAPYRLGKKHETALEYRARVKAESEAMRRRRG